MTNYGYDPDLEHISSEHPAGKDTLQTDASQHPSGPGEGPVKHVEKEFKDYFCPFCDNRLFRGKVRDFKMVCHKCNRLVDSKGLENNKE